MMLLPEKRSRLKCERKALDESSHHIVMTLTFYLCRPSNTSAGVIAVTHMSKFFPCRCASVHQCKKMGINSAGFSVMRFLYLA